MPATGLGIGRIVVTLLLVAGFRAFLSLNLFSIIQ
jgi:hypothetical protein